MRLRRLDLTRYGHFTDSSFELSAGKTDFHIVFGPNEAGKSTALTAIEDLLFGIPMKSPYNFLHDYASMRIGAHIESDSSSLEVLRRKGNKDTLLDMDDTPIAGGEGALRPYIAGADRSFFERMFSLDHVRLQAGGQEILDAQDDVGQMLFSAGAGIAGLREHLRELSDEAEELWGARRARHRKFYIADDKLQDAQKTLREHTLTASKWRELKRDYEEAKEAYVEIDKKIKETSAERNRLSRIRRVYRDVRRKQELDDKIAELGDVIELPTDAANMIAEAERREAEAAARIETLEEQLGRAEENLKKLTFDETLVQRAEDIDQLHERRIEVRGGKADLPKREAELNAEEEELRANATELEWTEKDSTILVEHIPHRSKVRAVRSLLNEKGELESDVSNCSRLYQESREAQDELQQQLDEISEPADVSRLAIVIKTLREQGDLAVRVRAAEKALKDAKGLLERKLKALNPGNLDEEVLATIAVPTEAMVQEHRELEKDWKRRLRETQQKVSSVKRELETANAIYDRSVQDDQVVTGEELDDARSRRNTLWDMVKLRHVQGEPIPEDLTSGFEKELDDLAAAFEPAMAKADGLADRRFDHAEEAGRIAELKRNIEGQETLLEQEKENEAELVTEGEQLQDEWTKMWASAPFEPLAPEAMLKWLAAREAVLEVVEEHREAESTLESLRDEEREAREQVLQELAAIGVDVATLEKDSLNVIIERASQEQRLRESEAEIKTQLEKQVENAAKDVARRHRDLEKANDAQNGWQEKWTTALGDLGLAEDTASEVVSTQIDVIDHMRETAGRIRTLRHDRIDKIKGDIADFDQVVSELVGEVAEDLKDEKAEAAVLELEKRLAEAKRVQGLREKEAEAVGNLTEQIEELEEERRDSTASISHLRKAAGVETKEALKEAIEQSDQHRSLEDERQQIIDKLKQDGDGMSISELVEECKDAVIDEVVAREDSIESDLEDLQKQQTDATEARSQAREAFQAVGGDDAAAQAAANKEEALAEMQVATEQYVRVKTSALLLQWAIDRYRREKQAPLLKRAGELFKIITGESFSSLQVAFNDQDNPHLTGVRPDGEIVPTSGMSTGTADQLYLALRVASIEDYLERAEALPFVADDLFINFDDERAAVGFKLLAELSQKTQVLFFTHHQHLVDIAQNSLGNSVGLVTLTDQQVATATG